MLFPRKYTTVVVAFGCYIKEIHWACHPFHVKYNELYFLVVKGMAAEGLEACLLSYDQLLSLQHKATKSMISPSWMGQ